VWRIYEDKAKCQRRDREEQRMGALLLSSGADDEPSEHGRRDRGRKRHRIKPRRKMVRVESRQEARDRGRKRRSKELMREEDDRGGRSGDEHGQPHPLESDLAEPQPPEQAKTGIERKPDDRVAGAACPCHELVPVGEISIARRNWRRQVAAGQSGIAAEPKLNRDSRDK
jgi:hypothetical protein